MAHYILHSHMVILTSNVKLFLNRGCLAIAAKGFVDYHDAISTVADRLTQFIVEDVNPGSDFRKTRIGLSQEVSQHVNQYSTLLAADVNVGLLECGRLSA